MLVTLIISGLCGALFLLYYKISRIYSYFEDRKIPHIKGKFLVGSDADQFLLRKSISISVDEFYWKMKNEKLFGVFLGFSPHLVISDIDYINKVLINDFEYFHDRNFFINEEKNPLEAHLFFLSGDRWKALRHTLTPIFTSAKLRFMFSEMKKCSDLFVSHIDKEANGKDIDLKDYFGRYATDVIASTAFGLEPESIVNPENKFRQMGKKVFEPNRWLHFLLFLRFSIPKMFVNLNIKTIPKDVEEFFCSIFLDMLEYRRKSGHVRKDFVQLLLEVSKQRFFKIDKTDLNENQKTTLEKNDESVEKIEITDLLLAAQAFVFFLAGFETVSDSFNYIAFALSKNKEAQDKARNEVIHVKEKYGDFTYDALKEMVYLDNCISESLRYYPSVPMLNRLCTKDYTFPDGTVVEKGTNIMIPVYSIHRDPRHYPDPHVFNPDRFNDRNVKNPWLVFGDGPRHCIAKRFALVEIKLLFAKILETFIIEESKLTEEPLKYVATMQLTPASPLYVKLTKLKTE